MSYKRKTNEKQKSWLDYLNSLVPLVAIVFSGFALWFSYRASQMSQQQFSLIHRPVINMEIKPFKDGKYLLVRQVDGHDLYVDIQVELENVGPVHAVGISTPSNVNSFLVDGTGSTSTVVVVQSTPVITLGPGQKMTITSELRWNSVNDEFGGSMFDNMRAGKDSFTLDLPINYGSPIDK